MFLLLARRLSRFPPQVQHACVRTATMLCAKRAAPPRARCACLGELIVCPPRRRRYIHALSCNGEAMTKTSVQRREFMALVGGATVWPRVAWAQQGRQRLGILLVGGREPFWSYFR